MALPEENRNEILRIRERIHTIEGTQVAHKFLIDDLREWRAQARVQLEQLVSAQEIADAVTAKLEERKRREWTWVQKIGAGVVLVLAPAAADLIVRAFGG